jgi:hypothetical protein
MLTQEGLVFGSIHGAVTLRAPIRCASSFNHVFGQIYIMNSIPTGGCLELMPAFDMDRVLWFLDHDRLTRFTPFPRSTRLLDVTASAAD